MSTGGSTSDALHTFSNSIIHNADLNKSLYHTIYTRFNFLNITERHEWDETFQIRVYDPFSFQLYCGSFRNDSKASHVNKPFDMASDDKNEHF